MGRRQLSVQLRSARQAVSVTPIVMSFRWRDRRQSRSLQMEIRFASLLEARALSNGLSSGREGR